MPRMPTASWLLTAILRALMTSVHSHDHNKLQDNAVRLMSPSSHSFNLPRLSPIYSLPDYKAANVSFSQTTKAQMRKSISSFMLAGPESEVPANRDVT